ncbi:elongation factor EF-2, partial [archaeon]|nr:elongation factor EF-2 [archaeon]
MSNPKGSLKATPENIGIIAHVDHGKTTLTDSLLMAAGLLSPTMAGRALALDYLPEEQERQMTIKAANISLYFEWENKPYIINLIDTPGHVDFTGKVTRSLRAIDGAIVVVDAVEGVMVQTETVTRQALEERVRPLLYINKIDRLIKELCLTPDKMQKRLASIINDFNNLIEMYAEPEFRNKWKVSVETDTVAFGSAKDKWGFTVSIARERGIGFKHVYEAYETGNVGFLQKKVPLYEAILRMVVKHIPPPNVAQQYRVPIIWKGDLDSEVGRAMLACKDDGPAVMCVTSVKVDPQAGVVATGRLFSGVLKKGMEVYLINAKRKARIQQVCIYMGPHREIVEEITAGNIPALLGISDARAGETLATVPDVAPFESLKYVTEPVITISIEPKYSRDLPKLVSILRDMSIEDPNLVVTINEETGEYLISGLGHVHLEIAIGEIQKRGIEIVTSRPIVVYRETVKTSSPVFEGKSPNKHNKLYISVEPLEEEIVEMIRRGELHDQMDRHAVARLLRQRGWDSDEARGVWAINEY